MSQTNNSGTGNPVDMNAVLTQSLSKGIDAMGNHQYKDGEPDTGYLAGIIPMDKAFVNGINTALAVVGDKISSVISPKIYEYSLKGIKGLNGKLGSHALSDEASFRVAGGVTLAANLALFLGESASKLYHDMSDQHDARTDMNRQLRMVYDKASDMKGNSVIKVQRLRMSKEASVTNMNTVLLGIGPNILNILGQSTNFQAMMTGEHREVLYQREHAEAARRLRADILAERGENAKPLSEAAINAEISKRIRKENSEGRLFGLGSGGFLLSQFFQAQAKSSTRRLEHHRQPYSAYEMIVGLQQQMGEGTNKGGRFALPGRRGGELQAKDYVAAIFDTHFKELADAEKDAVEIREALKEDLRMVSEAIAERLTKGELDPMQLIRLVGEGQIVKNKGRTIAGVDEVNILLDQMAGTKAHAMSGDAKEYFPGRPFTEQTLRDDFKHLDGEERLLLASSIPDAVLRKIGFKDAEIKEVQQFRASETYKELMAFEIKAVAAKDADELREASIGQTQVKLLHKTSESIDEKGSAALDKLLLSGGHADGVEQAVTDYVVTQMPRNKILLQTLLHEGKQLMQDTPAPKHDKREENEDAPKSHVEKYRAQGRDSERFTHGQNDNDGFADRERSRVRSGLGTHHQQG